MALWWYWLLTFQNSAGNVGQAVAVNVTGDRVGFYKTRVLGWQDTLYAHTGRQYYSNVDIEGVTDYIFGDATAYFDQCQLHNLDGWSITAQSRASASETTGYVFNQCTINRNSCGLNHSGQTLASLCACGLSQLLDGRIHQADRLG